MVPPDSGNASMAACTDWNCAIFGFPTCSECVSFFAHVGETAGANNTD
jgi:hypothetical protein